MDGDDLAQCLAAHTQPCTGSPAAIRLTLHICPHMMNLLLFYSMICLSTYLKYIIFNINSQITEYMFIEN